MVNGIQIWLLLTGPTSCSIKRESQPDETINSTMKLDQSKPRRRKVRTNVSLLLPFCLLVKHFKYLQLLDEHMLNILKYCNQRK